MAVTVKFRGDLGNNLFQYAIGRIIAEHLGLALMCEGDETISAISRRFLRMTAPSTLAGLAGHFPYAPLFIPGDIADAPEQAFDTDSEWEGQSLDLAAVLANRARRRITLHGYFQRFEYFHDSQDAIRRWLTLAPPPNGHHPGRRDVVVNIRRGFDFGGCGWVLPMSYYHDALGRITDVGRVYVCGTGVGPAVRAELAPYDPIYCDGSPIEHFSLMRQASRIVLSNSTFAWWAAFLSDAWEIYAPRSLRGTGYAFTGFRDVDLHMRAARYHELDVHEFELIECIVHSRMTGAIVHADDGEIVVGRPGEPAVRPGISADYRHAVERLNALAQCPIPVLKAGLADDVFAHILANLRRSGLVSVHCGYRPVDGVRPEARP